MAATWGAEMGTWPGLVARDAHAILLTQTRVAVQVAGMRSNLWPGACCACQGSTFANIYVGWGVKAGPFVPVPPPPVATECDAALVESVELPPKPVPEGEGAGEEGGEEDA